MELVETVYSEPYTVYSELYTCHIIRASFFADEIEVESLSNKTRSLKTEKRKKDESDYIIRYQRYVPSSKRFRSSHRRCSM